MCARATKRKPSYFKSLWVAVLAWGLFGAFALNVLPAEAAQKTRHSKKAKPRKPSVAHQKLRAALDQALEKDTGSGSQLGAASFYGFGFQGRRVASGERFNVSQLTAASNHYPLGSWVAVRRLDSERCVVVKVNDRMHARHKTRIIDLSRRAAEQLRMISAGVILVRVARLEEAPENSEVACRTAFADAMAIPGDCADCRPVPDTLPLPVLPNIGDAARCAAVSSCDSP